MIAGWVVELFLAARDAWFECCGFALVMWCVLKLLGGLMLSWSFDFLRCFWVGLDCRFSLCLFYVYAVRWCLCFRVSGVFADCCLVALVADAHVGCGFAVLDLVFVVCCLIVL